ncbi:hypothetical protein FRACYDRAFT_256013 [Fragilariopsis cylindrus CCMP1102]|uniref:Uncharacterized protein n=1 Tax=Fragilariopsis cylindrus CCMP1102 TaxID=635003 RepID=A0A1E7EJX8_9STRA|nr:hypothetical protein FRACYDRAFT_256013 [Fragilariopsis cylindrus CCMP1102]|eukprot:OEU06174.1 hypothetical protein FRACYDRAFT_256013 [Fragilariopsis cylindrus CCMP1102]
MSVCASRNKKSSSFLLIVISLAGFLLIGDNSIWKSKEGVITGSTTTTTTTSTNDTINKPQQASSVISGSSSIIRKKKIETNDTTDTTDNDNDYIFTNNNTNNTSSNTKYISHIIENNVGGDSNAVTNRSNDDVTGIIKSIENNNNNNNNTDSSNTNRSSSSNNNNNNNIKKDHHNTAKVSSSSSSSDSNDFDNDNNKYLLFYQHAGFSNQLMALDSANKLAKITNRILVLPPILPHCPEKASNIYPSWECKYGLSSPLDATNAVLWTNAWNVAIGENFPSITEIIDLNKIILSQQQDAEAEVEGTTKTTTNSDDNISNLPNFMKSFLNSHGLEYPVKENNSTSIFILKSIFSKHLYVGNLTVHKAMQKEDNKKNNKSSNITEQENPTTVLDLFQSNFKDKKIAVIGSAFTLKNSNCMDKTHPFRFFPPSLKLLKVLYSILLSSSKESSKISKESSSKITIGTDYVGVHIRFGDKWMTKKLDLYDIPSKDVESMELFNTIKVEESTRILILDQLLLGLGNKFIVEQDYGNMPGKSSFQSMIQSRHNKRQELISTIQREGRS